MQNEKCKTNDLSDRFLDFGANIIKLCGRLYRTFAGRKISNQLVDSGTSTGANYEEARAAESRADFIHKMQVVLKELRETLFWLRLTKKVELLQKPDTLLPELLQEADELNRIIAKSIVTAKSKRH